MEINKPGAIPELPDRYALYIDAAAAVVDLSIPATCRQAVANNFSQIAAMAQVLMQFPLSQDVEAAPVFRP